MPIMRMHELLTHVSTLLHLCIFWCTLVLVPSHRTQPKGASANPVWGGDEAPRPPVPPAQNLSSQESVTMGASRQDLQPSQKVAAVQRPQSAMQLSRTNTDGGVGGGALEEARIRLTECIEVGVNGDGGLQGGGKVRSRPLSASLARTTSSVSIGSGLKSSMEAADQNLVQVMDCSCKESNAFLHLYMRVPQF